MADDRISLSIPPGIYRNGTKLQSKGRWYDANGVRFMDGTVVRPIGGWRRAPDDANAPLDALTGVPRGAHVWLSNSGDVYLGLGTTQKLYVTVGGVLTDITPDDFATGRVDSSQPGSETMTGQGGSAYGQGPYDDGPYGQGSTFGVHFEADTWSLEEFGAYLVALSTSDQRLLVWQNDPSLPAAPATGAPSGACGVVVTPERFVVMLGVTSPSEDEPTGILDVRSVAWATQETFTDWIPSNVNSAGDFVLSTPGRLMCGHRTRRETLLWTDCDLQTMTYIGGDLIYRFDQAGDKCGIISKRAFAVVDTQAFWMGKNGFFMYDGFVKALPSDVQDYVFSDFNRTQEAKVWATSISEFGEVWWFYPSATSTEIDRYVVYNYRENHWTIGKLARTAGCDADGAPYPVLCAPTGEIYEHECGQLRTGMTPYLESGPNRLDEGDRVIRVQKLYPDEKNAGDVRATFITQFEPEGPETVRGPYAPAAETDVRFTGRLVSVRLDEVVQEDWRIGTFQFGTVTGGRR